MSSSAQQVPHLKELAHPSALLNELLAAGVLARFEHRGIPSVLADDVTDVSRVRVVELEPHQYILPIAGQEPEHGIQLPDGSILVKRRSASRRSATQAAVGAQIRHLIDVAEQTVEASTDMVRADATEAFAIGGEWYLRPNSAAVSEAGKADLTRRQLLESAGAEDLANSAYYMGTKRLLTPLISQAAATWLPPDTLILDLMCGSGSVSGALGRNWPVIASDAMTFCRLLAAVQSAGFSEAEAYSTIGEVTEVAQENFRLLSERIGVSLALENEIFYTAETGGDFQGRYQEFVAGFPSFPIGGATGCGWDPLEEVKLRQSTESTVAPACLFTAYFANVYFGLRQAAEIDSLRYGIARLSDHRRRTWALGALIASTSRVSTAYGGHFAQPRVSSRVLAELLAKRVSDRTARLNMALRQRTLSVRGEFQARLVALGRASEHYEHEVRIVDGPWQNALRTFNSIPGSAPKAVYLDAPYKRDEYSRYYHVLETLAKYDYPSAEGDARMPSKALGDRFGSEFATRTRGKVTSELARAIDAILESGHTCLWSYSNGAASSVGEVLDALRCKPRFVKSVSTEHGHKAQGRASEQSSSS